MKTTESMQVINNHIVSDNDIVLSTLTETDRAYLAGLIDGEGCITGYVTKRRRFHSRITISNTDLALMDWIKGKVNFFHIYKSSHYSNKHKQGYVAQIGNRYEIYSFLRCVSPYLVIKKERANRLIDLIRDRIVSGKFLSDNVVERAMKFRDYNRKGLDENCA